MWIVQWAGDPGGVDRRIRIHSPRLEHKLSPRSRERDLGLWGLPRYSRLKYGGLADRIAPSLGFPRQLVYRFVSMRGRQSSWTLFHYTRAHRIDIAIREHDDDDAGHQPVFADPRCCFSTAEAARQNWAVGNILSFLFRDPSVFCNSNLLLRKVLLHSLTQSWG